MCFFPWVGLVIGALEFGWFHLAVWLGFGTIFRTAVLVLIPVLVTGGIHLDGLLDTADAMSSWREKERRLEILKDSHAGAFAVIIGLCYFVICFGAASEVTDVYKRQVRNSLLRVPVGNRCAARCFVSRRRQKQQKLRKPL